MAKQEEEKREQALLQPPPMLVETIKMSISEEKGNQPDDLGE